MPDTLRIFLCASCLLLMLSGCPHQMVEQFEENLPPADYRPVYLVGSQSAARIDSIVEQYRRDSLSGYVAGATPQYGANPVALADVRPLRFEVRRVDDAHYPDSVVLEAVVFDYKQRYISGLAPPYYEGAGSYRRYWTHLVDSCHSGPAAIPDFRVREVRENAAAPHAFAYVLDHSGSMGLKRIEILQNTAVKMVKVLKEQDWVSVVKFAAKPYASLPMANRPDSVRERIHRDDRHRISGGTAIYDAVLEGLAQLEQAPREHTKVMVLLSDGMDQGSAGTLDSALHLAKQRKVRIYTIAFGLGFMDAEALTRLASYTNGRFYRIYSSKEFPYVFADIYLTLRNYYRISYKPPECGGRHAVLPELTVPEIGRGALRARGEYDRAIFKPYDPVGATVLLNIEFESGKAILTAEARPYLREVCEALRNNPRMKIRITGHTDEVGSESDNLELSRMRAAAVKQALVEAGIAPARITTEGRGESEPLVPNNSPENRRKNRRTEFVITEQ